MPENWQEYLLLFAFILFVVGPWVWTFVRFIRIVRHLKSVAAQCEQALAPPRVPAEARSPLDSIQPPPRFPAGDDDDTVKVLFVPKALKDHTTPIPAELLASPDFAD